MKRLRLLYGIYILIIIVAGIIVLWYVSGFVSDPGKIPFSFSKPMRITVHRGDTPATVVQYIKRKYPEVDEEMLLFLMEKNNVSEKLKADYIYCIPDKGTYEDIVKAFDYWCDKAFVMITFPEGITIKDMANILYTKTNTPTTTFLQAAGDKNVLGRISHIVSKKVSSAEGFLYPDTYAYNGNVSMLISSMISNFIEKTSIVDWQEARRRTGLTKYEIIILASIVEKEAVKKEEAPIIAGVFINRLRRGMKLESCPTVEYALGVHKKVLSLEDIKIDSPYNTYKYYGLPPTPIGNPSINAIEAVVHYKKTDYLYFVADGKGGHLFAKTYAEHLANIRRVESGK